MPFKGTDLTEADVLAVFGLVSREALEGLAESILKGDIPGILRTVATLDESGKDMRRMTAELLWHFRNLLVCQQAGAELAKQDVTAEQLAVLEAQAKLAPPQRIVEISSLLSEMEGKLRAALSVRTLVEMTLIRCARAAKTVSLDEVIRRLTALRDQTIRRLAAAAPQGPAAAPAVPQRAAPPAAEPPRPVAPPQPTPEEDLVPEDEEELEPCLLHTPPEPVGATPPVPAEPLQNSDGQYVDEIVNITLRLFGGHVRI